MSESIEISVFSREGTFSHRRNVSIPGTALGERLEDLRRDYDR